MNPRTGLGWFLLALTCPWLRWWAAAVLQLLLLFSFAFKLPLYYISAASVSVWCIWQRLLNSLVQPTSSSRWGFHNLVWTWLNSLMRVSPLPSFITLMFFTKSAPTAPEHLLALGFLPSGHQFRPEKGWTVFDSEQDPPQSDLLSLCNPPLPFQAFTPAKCFHKEPGMFFLKWEAV